jgi:hypothetical protein
MTTTTDPTMQAVKAGEDQAERESLPDGLKLGPPHTMHVLNGTGDAESTWDPAIPAEVDAARAMFDSLRGRGYLAYTATEGGGKGDILHEFDPEAGRIVMSRPIVGG